ncbi:GntR family transcriptional regulator, transcriptional repressor for pyruvate dehydrogenase complex [Desulforhopalus singaporensis]|uniref:GntR family transcriptional regulator, transcriptional repressor for pyruvate dehydrogenase complex n=1 Tax=Desulforhopalus singaporensis TaxID=91360 RepID=A0A1H0RP19_9BACT|nr:GntR family transcriptional regulator, transcriptional repressor for pyruvate dehydrogenase complex [Desulforhopalus singaporensis]
MHQVAEQILLQIKNNTLPPGSRLPSQRDLSQKLGVGRSSVREAINVLVVKGYLEPIQGKGTFVKSVLPGSDERLERLSTAVEVSSIFNLMEARLLLECKSAALAAERADLKDLKKLEKVFAQITAERESYNLFLEDDFKFHITLAEATKNDVICEMTKLVLDKLAEHHTKFKTDQLSQNYKKISVDTATEVFNAVKKHNCEDASFWMKKHLSVITNELSKVL